MTGQDESIKVEFSIREPILEPVEHLPARTLLVDPFRQTAAVAAGGRSGVVVPRDLLPRSCGRP